jgi:hypothetical protein
VRGPRLLDRVPLVAPNARGDVVLGQYVTLRLLRLHGGMCRCCIQKNALGSLTDSYVTADATTQGLYRGCPERIVFCTCPSRQGHSHPPFAGHRSRLTRHASTGPRVWDWLDLPLIRSPPRLPTWPNAGHARFFDCAGCNPIPPGRGWFWHTDDTSGQSWCRCSQTW